MPGGAVQPRGNASKISVKKPTVKKKKDQGSDESVVDRVKNFVGSVGKNWADMLGNDSSGNGSVTGALRNAGSLAAPQIAQASGYRGKLTGAGISDANSRARSVANDIDTRAAIIAGAAGGAGALAKSGARAAGPALRAAGRSAGVALEPKTNVYAMSPRKSAELGIGGKLAGASGKTRAAVVADVAKAANKRAKSESSTIAAGTAKSRTQAGAETLEKQEAAMASRKSVNDAPKSPVDTNRPASDKSTASSADIRAFAEKRGFRDTFVGKPRKDGTRASTFVQKRTPAQIDRAASDLEKTMREGSAARAAGKAPGGDVPDRSGQTYLSTKDADPGPPRPLPPKAPAEALRDNAAKGMKGKKAQENLAQRNRDYSEGRRDAEGNLKGASAKSARRQQEKVDKAAGVKKPSAKVNAIAKEETSKASAAPKATGKKPSAKVEAVAKSETPASPKPAKPKAAAEPTPPKPGQELVRVPSTRGQKTSGPIIKSGAPRPHGGGRTKDLVVRPASDIVEGKVLASRNVASKGSKWKGRAVKAGVTGAALGATGLAINKANLGGKKTDDVPAKPSPATAPPSKPMAAKAAIEAKDAAQAKDKKFGPTGESRFLKGRPAVRQSVIDGFKKRGMTKSLALVKAHKDDPEYLEAVRRYYGEKRLKKALGS